MYENTYTLKTVGGLITNTYILGIITAIVFIVISLLVANMIAYEGGKAPQDPRKRRIWFYILAVFGAVVFFFWNYFYVSQKIKGAPAQNEFLQNVAIATGLVLVVYFIIGFATSKLMRKGKYGTIFPSKA